MGNSNSPFDICLVCATFEEAKALISVISTLCDVKFIEALNRNRGYKYSYTTIQNSKGELLTIHVSWQSAYGPAQATAHLEMIIKECNPRFIGMTGVCAGNKEEVRLGDVVVAGCAFMCDDVMSVGCDKNQARRNMKVYHIKIDKAYFCRIFNTKIGFIANLQHPIHQKLSNETPFYPDLHIAPMASVNTVRRDDPFRNIQTLMCEAVAIDMEGASFYRTVASHPGLRSLVIKGVCDYADSEKNDDYHEYASKASAAYMLYFIKEYITSDLTSDFLLPMLH